MENAEYYPIALELLDDRKLRIVWSDDSEQLLDPELLRSQCPCATCREKKKGDAEREASRAPGELPVLGAMAGEPIQVARMRPAGNYAYNIQFSDGHTTGVFTFDLLRSLGS